MFTMGMKNGSFSLGPLGSLLLLFKRPWQSYVMERGVCVREREREEEAKNDR